jgi:CRP-like cAMP-binding protein
VNVFLELVKTNGQFSWQLNRLLSQEIFNQMKRLEAIACMPARDRLEHFFCDLIHEQEPAELQEPAEFRVTLKNQELAQMVAVTREHLCRLLKEMEQEGVIRRDKGSLIVPDFTGFLRKGST